MNLIEMLRVVAKDIEATKRDGGPALVMLLNDAAKRIEELEDALRILERSIRQVVK